MKRRILRLTPNLRKLIFRLLSILIVILIIILLFDARTEPIIRNYSKTAAKNEAGLIVNDTVAEILKDENITYSTLVSIEKDKDGNIKAITTDIVNLNLLKAEINSKISQSIENKGYFKVKIPFGVIFGSDLLSGLGPDIGTDVKMSGNTKSEITNEFLSAGINQTLHRIMLNIEIEIMIILPKKQTTVLYKTNMCIAETVIVGITPSSFGRIYA